VDAFLELKAWPDAAEALHTFKANGLRLAFLSNFTEKMLNAGIRNSGFEGLFEQVLSTDRVKTFKPSPRTYQMGVDTLRLHRSEIVFVAFAGWDAAGARSYGYPTFWVNRLQSPLEALEFTPDAMGANLGDLDRWLRRSRPATKS